MMSPDGTQRVTWTSTNVPAMIGSGQVQVESFFGQRRTIFDRQMSKRIWFKKVVIPASGVFKFRIRIPRIWPVFTEDVTALDYLVKNKCDRTILMQWHSMCGLIARTGPNDPATAADVHTEKQTIAMRILRHVVGVRYAYEPFVQVFVRDTAQFNTGIGVPTSTNRAKKFHIHMDAEAINAVPGQSTD